MNPSKDLIEYLPGFAFALLAKMRSNIKDAEKGAVVAFADKVEVQTDSPVHNIRLSADGLTAYICTANGTLMFADVRQLAAGVRNKTGFERRYPFIYLFCLAELVVIFP